MTGHTLAHQSRFIPPSMKNEATQVGIIIVVLTIGGMLAGKFIDSSFHSAPIGILSGIFIGIISASILLFFKFSSIIKNQGLLYTKDSKETKGGVSMNECQKCGHAHDGVCDCGCVVAKCPECNHTHGTAVCECGCDK